MGYYYFRMKRHPDEARPFRRNARDISEKLGDRSWRSRRTTSSG
jgi:hypothetical protein